MESTQTRNLAYVLAEQTDRALQSVRLVTSAIVEHFEALDLSSPDEFERVGGEPDISSLLKGKISGLQHIDNVSLASSRGKLVNRSRPGPLPDIDLSAREYIAAAKLTSKGELIITSPARSLTTGKWAVFLAQRISGRDGQLLGVISGVLELDKLEELYSRVTLGPNGTITIVRTDGLVLTRYPHSEKMIGSSLAGVGAFSQLIEKGRNGVIEILSPVDGQERVVAAYAAPNFPVALIVTSSLRDVLSGWLRERTVLVFWGILACLVIAFFTLVLAGSAQELADAQSNLLLAEAERRQNEKFVHRARHDALTGLANRLQFREELVARLAALPDGTRLAIHYLDLDRFKQVNDTLGHPVGDALLIKVARRFGSTLRPTDLLARLGGDEFAIIQYVTGGPEHASALASRLIKQISRPFALGQNTVSIGTSIGIALAPDHGTDPDYLVQSADMALYAVKARGRGAFEFFHPEMEESTRSRVLLEQEMRAALEFRQFELHYQPQVNLDTGQITAFEALLRWNHPVRGQMPPGEFISLAEETGLIGPIGEWVLRHACAQAATWPRHLRIAVNVSAAQFRTSDVPAAIAKALQHSDLPASRLEIEVTESLMLNDSPDNIAALRSIRNAGVLVSLDDFGTGYSSLGCLTLFPFNRLKIDRSFIKALGAREDCSAIVRSATGLAKNLGMRTTAEGIETEEQMARARIEGCTDGQGYLFGRPMPPAELRRYLEAAKPLVRVA